MRQFTRAGYEHPILPVFAPGGRWVHGYGFVATWDLHGAAAAPVWTDYESAGFLFRLIASPCGRFLAGAEDRCVVVWDVAAGTKGRWIAANANGDHISDVAFTPDGAHLLTACLGAGGVQRWRTGSWRRKPAFGTRARNDGALAISPDGTTLATVDVRDDEARIKLWSYPKGTHRKTAATGCGAPVRLGFSPDGRLLTGNENWERVRVWDARTLRPVAEYVPAVRAKGKKKANGPVQSFAFHPSGRWLAVAASAGPVEFVDVATWRPVAEFDWGHGPSYGVAFSADGALAAVGASGRFVVWDVDL